MIKNIAGVLALIGYLSLGYLGLTDNNYTALIGFIFITMLFLHEQ